MVQEHRRYAERGEQYRDDSGDNHRIGLTLPTAEHRGEGEHGIAERRRALPGLLSHLVLSLLVHLHSPDGQNPANPLSNRGRAMMPTQLRGRSVAYVTVLGAIVALLAAGLAIPY